MNLKKVTYKFLLLSFLFRLTFQKLFLYFKLFMELQVIFFEFFDRIFLLVNLLSILAHVDAKARYPYSD